MIQKIRRLRSLSWQPEPGKKKKTILMKNEFEMEIKNSTATSSGETMSGYDHMYDKFYFSGRF